jgi:hypothetical protein
MKKPGYLTIKPLYVVHRGASFETAPVETTEGHGIFSCARAGFLEAYRVCVAQIGSAGLRRHRSADRILPSAEFAFLMRAGASPSLTLFAA